MQHTVFRAEDYYRGTRKLCFGHEKDVICLHGLPKERGNVIVSSLTSTKQSKFLLR